ncbi:MAG: hypothetical protein ACKOXJ_07455, partial [Alphaproteobacteria bacterium]
MIKNLLYSFFIHLILFLIIYFAFLKKEKIEIETENEVLISVEAVSNKGIPPINEIVSKKSEIKEVVKKNIESKRDINPNPKIKEMPKASKKTSIDPNNKSKDKIKIDQPKIEELVKEDMQKFLDSQNVDLPKIPEDALPKPVNDEKPKEENSLNILNLKALKNITNQDQGSSLSARETVNIQSQIKMCYKRALEESGFESKTKIVVKIQISIDGYIENDLDDTVDFEK